MGTLPGAACLDSEQQGEWERLRPSCASCHGPAALGPGAPSAPSLTWRGPSSEGPAWGAGALGFSLSHTCLCSCGLGVFITRVQPLCLRQIFGAGGYTPELEGIGSQEKPGSRWVGRFSRLASSICLSASCTRLQAPEHHKCPVQALGTFRNKWYQRLLGGACVLLGVAGISYGSVQLALRGLLATEI